MSDDFDDLFDDVDKFHERLARKMFEEIKDLERAVQEGKLKGEWDIRPIEEPGATGYVARGRFQFGDKQLPKTLKLPGKITEEVREPLTDVFENDDNIKLYMELPGVEKADIQLNISENRVDIKARNLHKAIDLPTSDIETDKTTTNYRNGVLEVTIPKTRNC